MINSKRILPIIISTVMVFALIQTLPAEQVYAENYEVAIGSGSTVPGIQSTVKSYLDTAVSGDSVTVISTKSNVTNDTLTLDIPSGVKVVWNALYSGGSDEMIALKGEGTFEVATGTISNNMAASTTIKVLSGEKTSVVVSGGTIEAKGNSNNAILTDIGNVTVTGGTVCSDTSLSIRTMSGDIVISGGTIETTSGPSSTIYSDYGNININSGYIKSGGNTVNSSAGIVSVSGGTIESTGTGYSAINTTDNYVRVTGGIVKNTNPGGWAISTNKAAAYLAGTCSGAFKANGGAMIVQVDRLGISPLRNGTSTGLKLMAGSGNSVWNMSSANPKIAFTLSDIYTSKVNIEWGSKLLPPTKNQLDISSLLDKPYTGKAQGITATSKAGIGKVTAVYYTGAKGTTHKKTTVKPKNIGTYNVTADIEDGDKYHGMKNMLIGTFKIVPKKNSVSKAAAGNKKMTIKWKKVSKVQKVTGYQIRYRVKTTKNNGKWKIKTVKATKSSVVIKNLKKGKKYEVQIRSNKVISKENHYSAWSKIKTSGIISTVPK